MLISPAFAAEAAAATPLAGTAGDILGTVSSFFPLIIVLFVFYFLVIRPQNARLQEHRKVLKSLQKGDQVVTGGGLVATVTKAVEGAEEISLRLADGVEVTALRSTIMGRHQPSKSAAST